MIARPPHDLIDPPAAVLAEGAAYGLPDRASWRLLQGGRVNACWRAGDTVLKVFARSAGTPLFGNDVNAEWQALTALAPVSLAPEPLHRGMAGGMPWIAMRAVDGPRATDETALGGLAALHHRTPIAVPPLTQAICDAQCDQMLRQLAPDLSARLQHARPPLAFPDGPPVLLHGDPVCANILTRDGRAIFIDWQCPALGDPCHDIAIFVSPGMRCLYGGEHIPTDALHARLDAYGSASVVQRYLDHAAILHWRIAVYCAWMAAAGHDDYRAAMAAELDFVAAA